jgi:hypothetical protein
MIIHRQKRWKVTFAPFAVVGHVSVLFQTSSRSAFLSSVGKEDVLGSLQELDRDDNGASQG